MTYQIMMIFYAMPKVHCDIPKTALNDVCYCIFSVEKQKKYSVVAISNVFEGSCSQVTLKSIRRTDYQNTGKWVQVKRCSPPACIQVDPLGVRDIPRVMDIGYFCTLIYRALEKVSVRRRSHLTLLWS